MSRPGYWFGHEGHFYGFAEESLDLVEKEWIRAAQAGAPYDGILGFSSGSFVSALFNVMRVQKGRLPTGVPKPKFQVLMNYWMKPVALNYPEYWCDDAAMTEGLKQITDYWEKERELPAGFVASEDFKKWSGAFDPEAE